MSTLCFLAVFTLVWSGAMPQIAGHNPSLANEAFAATKHKKHTSKPAKKTHASRKKSGVRAAGNGAVDPDKYSALVINAKTGKILYQKNAAALRYPASLTKMMTLYLTFEALKSGELKPNDTIEFSEKAASQPSTNLFVQPGDTIPVHTAVDALVIRSANDVAMAMAERLGGTQWDFALKMTQKARQLGMKNTVFRNPNGLPDTGQYTTAIDLAKLAIALRRDFPEYYGVFNKRSFDFNGRTYTTHNRVLLRYAGADGLKTGFTNASGFNLVTSAKRGGIPLVAVVMGGRTATARDNQMISLLNQTYTKLAANDNNEPKTADNGAGLGALSPASGSADDAASPVGQGDTAAQ